MSDEGPADRIAIRDEVLEMLYWVEGERLTSTSSPDALARFLTHPAHEVQAVLEELAARGLVSPEGSEYRLTEVGRREAGRRFADQFAPMLGQGHGECNDPECDCHTNPAGAAECHAKR